MPPPQLNGKTQTRERPTYEEMVLENLQETKTEVKETRQELNARMDKQDEKIDRLASKIDSFKDRADTNRRIQPNISIVDLWHIVVTIAVLYAIFK